MNLFKPFKAALRWLIGVEEQPLTEAECTLCDVEPEEIEVTIGECPREPMKCTECDWVGCENTAVWDDNEFDVDGGCWWRCPKCGKRCIHDARVGSLALLIANWAACARHGRG